MRQNDTGSCFQKDCFDCSDIPELNPLFSCVVILGNKKKWSPWDGEVGRVGEWWGNGMGCEYHKNKSGHNYFPGILESSSTYHQFWNSGQKHLTPDSRLFPLKKVNSHFSDSLWFISVEKGRMWCKTKTLFPETALWNLNKSKTQLIHFPSVTLKLN